jgi:hypothetical protein
MRNPALLFTVIALLLSASCSEKKSLTSVNVQRTPARTANDGFYYFLPRTHIAVDVAVTKTLHQPGPFAQYAESLLGLEQVIRTPSVTYSISEISINSFAEPDPDHFYFINFNQQLKPPFISLSESGLIRGVNKSYESDDYHKVFGESKEFGHFDSEATFNYFIDINLQERIDTILERVRLDTMTVERQTLRRSWVEKSTDIRAKEVADYILKIRDKKFDLITGFAEITYSKEALKYMYDEMNRKENDYLALFTGISSSSTIRYRYTYIPDRTKSPGPHTLFYFSRSDGVLSNNISGSIPVSIEAQQAHTESTLTPLVQRTQNDRSANRGFYYRIPEHSTIIIREGNNARAEARLPISQFGVVTTLPPYDLEIEFHPNTGSIKSVGVSTD